MNFLVFVLTNIIQCIVICKSQQNYCLTQMVVIEKTYMRMRLYKTAYVQILGGDPCITNFHFLSQLMIIFILPIWRQRCRLNLKISREW